MLQYETEEGKIVLIAGNLIDIKDNTVEFLTFTDNKIVFSVMKSQILNIDQKKPVMVYYKSIKKSKKVQLLTIYNIDLTKKEYAGLYLAIQIKLGNMGY